MSILALLLLSFSGSDLFRFNFTDMSVSTVTVDKMFVGVPTEGKLTTATGGLNAGELYMIWNNEWISMVYDETQGLYFRDTTIVWPDIEHFEPIAMAKAFIDTSMVLISRDFHVYKTDIEKKCQWEYLGKIEI